MRKALPTMVFAMACIALPVRADRYSYVTVRQAAQAMQVMVRNQVVRASCAPRADHASGGTTYWQVDLNDAPVDLAHLYVARVDGWENLALQEGVPASDVSRRLDPAQTGR